MSKYTTEVRFICEQMAGLRESEGYNSIDNIIEKSRSKVFPSYPIFDESYRGILETKILKRYYTREICAETFGRWKLFLDSRMNEIMPYYNQLYESALLEFNPLYDVEYTEKTDREDTRNGTETGIETGSNTLNSNNTRVEDINKANASTVSNSSYESGESIGAGQKSRNEDINRVNANTETMNGNSETDTSNTESSNTTDKNNKWDLHSDTPQGGVQGISGALGNNYYLTDARHSFDDPTAGSVSAKNGSNIGNSETTASQTTNRNGSENEDNIIAESESKNNEYSKNINGSNNGSGSENEDNIISETGVKTGNYSVNKNGSSNIKNIGDYITRVSGKRGLSTYSKMLMEFRDTFINIDEAIINRLADLFMMIY